MNLSRRLAEGVGSWLHFEFCCHRSTLFSERYLTGAIGPILQSTFNSRAFAEVNHPILAPMQLNRGRKPQLDFAVMSTYPKINVAVESKWCGENGLALADVLWDLVRLELVAQTGAEAFFVLAGKAKDLRSFWTHPFLDTDNRPYLPRPEKGQQQSSLRIASPPLERLAELRKLVAIKPELAFPAVVKVTAPFVFPTDAATYGFQVYVWKVISVANRQSFLPKNHRAYAAFITKKKKQATSTATTPPAMP